MKTGPGYDSNSIAFFQGTWTLNAHQEAGPMGPAGPFTGTQNSDLSPGGALLMIRASEKRPQGPLQVWTASWYDTAGQKFRMVADLLGQIVTFTGTLDGQTWTYLSDSDTAGTPTQRITIQRLSGRSYSWKTELQQAGGAWALLEQGTATK